MRALFALLAIVAALVGGVFVVTARLGESATLRETIAGQARDELGVALELSGVRVALFPPRIELENATLHLERGSALEIGHATFDVALLPLLTEARADVDAVVIDGPVTFRTEEASVSGVARGRATRRDLNAWSLDLSGSLANGGTFVLDGTRSRSATRLELSIDDVAPAPLVALVPKAAKRAKELEGVFDGTLLLTESDAQGRTLEVDVESEAAKLRAKDVIVDGPVAISATLDWTGELPLGPFEIDASRADVGYAIGRVRAATGRGAMLSGVLVEKKGRVRVDDVRLSVSAFQGQIGGN